MDLEKLATMSAFIQEQMKPLAERLGQTAAFTYGIFIKQVWVYALENLLWMPIGIIALIWGIRLFNWTKKEGDVEAK